MDFLNLAKEYESSYLEDLNTLVSIHSIRDLSTKTNSAPFGQGPRQALDAFLEMGKRDGFDTKDIDGYAGVISYGEQKDTVGILGHLDIVPIGEDWSKEPLKVTLDDGYVFGRGVMDDKGPTLAAYYALKLLKDHRVPLKKRVMLIAGCDEESGMECIQYYKKHAEIPQTGFVPDADFPVIYGEKGGAHVTLSSKDDTVIKKMKAGTRPNIVIGKADCIVPSITDQQKEQFELYLKTNVLKGSIQEVEEGIQLHIDGIFSHAAWPYNGVNAALHLLNFVGCAFNDTLSSDLYSLLKDWQGKPEHLNIDGEYMGFLTMSTGIVDIENDQTRVLIDIRYPNDIDANTIVERFEDACKALKSNIEVHLDSDMVPMFVDPSSPLVTELMNVYQKYTKDMFHGPKTIGGGTYARMFDNFVSFGPELPFEEKSTEQFVGGPHQRDEGAKLANLIQAIAIYADAILALAG